MAVAFSLSDGRADAYGLRAPLLARVPMQRGPVAATRQEVRPFAARLARRARDRGGEQPSKWGRFPIAPPRVLGDAGSNRKEREMEGSIVCAGKGVRISGGALHR
jgi:hypothetical protein